MKALRIKAWSVGWFLLGILVASLVTCHAAAQGHGWHGLFGTVDYSRGGGLRHVVALERRDSR